MRKAINENPVVQAALIGVLVVAVALLLLTRMGGSSGGAEVIEGATTTEVAETTDPALPATPAAPAPAAPGETPAPAAEGVPPGAEFTAGPGLPKAVVEAYDAGDAVVLLVVNERGIDDRRVKPMVEALEGHPETAVFVTDVRKVSEYARITEGVDLDRTPALVVIRPRALTDGPVPTAVVSYGFRGAASVEQALENALYKGPQDLPYYPE